MSARSTRNTAERNGMVNIEFVVTVPQALQKDNWMLNIRPVLMRGGTPDSLKELRFTGQRFREHKSGLSAMTVLSKKSSRILSIFTGLM